jgi:phenylpyruvate tautomerase PptA (4-oxalocrotonate tautomerase family)
MPVVTARMYEGRNFDQNLELVKAITDVMVRVTGNKPEDIHVVTRRYSTRTVVSAGYCGWIGNQR